MRKFAGNIAFLVGAAAGALGLGALYQSLMGWSDKIFPWPTVKKERE